MSNTDEVLEVVRQWVKKADNDLKNAEHSLKLGRSCPTDTVCFHAQQRVEKYLKAFLTFKGIDFPKTHNIAELTAHLRKRIAVKLTPEEQERLTDYATVARYPGDYDEIPLSEAKRAVGIAHRIRKGFRKLLPGKALLK